MTFLKEKLFFVLVGLLSLAITGCVQYGWVHPTKTTAQFHQDKYQCNIESSKIYPPTFQTILKAQDQRTTTDCYNNGRNRSTCTKKETGYFPSTEVVDANQRNRDNLLRECLYNQGWRMELIDY